ncbi:MAG: putative dehydrogenase [Candidatus Alkanophagales archaeon MCA70_species_2]|nr:putative dehydrogenase [Candidatus Alkanophaga liquidiphilum]RLG39104.1 MAG: gfo/Idh/MocA family oxidoreductase [Candidatus Alkanophagales archaeon]
MRVGVIGVGKMGVHHARIYSQMEGVELVGVADVDEEKASEVAKLYDTKAFTDCDELLKCVDAVSIAVPTTQHEEVAIAAIEHGVHCLIEKPIAHTLKSARNIVDAARDAGVKIMIGHVERFNPAVIALKGEIDAGKLGNVVSISSKRVGPHPPRIRDVGVIIDLAVHDIDVISFLYGKNVRDVSAIAGNGMHSHEDYASILLGYEGNKAGLVDTNWLTPHKVRVLVAVGVKGVAYMDYIAQTLEIHRRDFVEDVFVEKREPLRSELEYFLRGIVHNEELSPSGEEGIHALAVALAAVKSCKARRTVVVDENLLKDAHLDEF